MDECEFGQEFEQDEEHEVHCKLDSVADVDINDRTLLLVSLVDSVPVQSPKSMSIHSSCSACLEGGTWV